MKKILNFFINTPKKIINWVIKAAHLMTKENLNKVKDSVIEWFTRLVSFIVVLTTYIVIKSIIKLIMSKHFPKNLTIILEPKLEKFYFRVISINTSKNITINRVNLIEMSLKNMRSKLTRTIITVGGMAVGISAIVFLVSIGYGLQELVTSRVARLEEMKQIEVSVQPGSKVKITDETLAKFKEITEVKYALPVIALVGKVSYKNSISDMAVYGVTKEYLQESAVKPVKGNIFDSNELGYVNVYPMTQGEVAGLSVTNINHGDKIRSVEFNIFANAWIPVRESPNEDSKLLGYTKRTEGQQSGEEIWGGSYTSSTNGRVMKDSEGNYYGKWINSKVLLWRLEGRKFDPVNNNYGGQDQIKGYIPEINMEVTGSNIIEASVLGLSTASSPSAVVSGSEAVQQLDDGWVYIEGEVDNQDETKVVKVPLPSTAKRKAVVNRAVLNVLGIDENEAIGKTFQVSFIIPNSLLTSEKEKIESELSEYEIVGVVPIEDTPMFYVPFVDLKSLGITNYSQVKVGVDKEVNLLNVRKRIEASGYNTTSVVDTVAQIDSLFGTIRKVLALAGTVALAVASLGMFNTLTVSLLERTREIGLMKSMGMRSKEVEELFLSESMVMGFFGGFIGLIAGTLFGKLVGFLLSIFALFKGVGYVDISSVPVPFAVLIIVLSLTVGFITGIYPARRATKISALNALRYE